MSLVKEKAVRQCRDTYVLADCSKFEQVSSVTFREFAPYAYSDREDSGRVSGMWKCFESGIKNDTEKTG